MTTLTATLYRLAIACWLGGNALFTIILTPIIFATYPRDTAGGIVGALFPGYFRWGLICGVIALACLVPARINRPRLAAAIIAVMLAITAAQSFVILPKAEAVKREIPSLATTPADHPARSRFRRLHGISATGNLAVIAGGIALIAIL